MRNQILSLFLFFLCSGFCVAQPVSPDVRGTQMTAKKGSYEFIINEAIATEVVSVDDALLKRIEAKRDAKEEVVLELVAGISVKIFPKNLLTTKKEKGE